MWVLSYFHSFARREKYQEKCLGGGNLEEGVQELLE